MQTAANIIIRETYTNALYVRPFAAHISDARILEIQIGYELRKGDNVWITVERDGIETAVAHVWNGDAVTYRLESELTKCK